MANIKFKSGFNHRSLPAKLADAILINNSDTGNDEYITIGELLSLVSGFEPANPNIQAHIANWANPHHVKPDQMGLDLVDNTSDINKPVSTFQQTALNTKAPINNPTFTGTVGGITPTMIGLGNVDNTADNAKVVFTASRLVTSNYAIQEVSGQLCFQFGATKAYMDQSGNVFGNNFELT
jgi:hypothetical protein